MDFKYYALAIKKLALEPVVQCRAQGDYNVAQEIQFDIILGRSLIGRRRLSLAQEKAILNLAEAASNLPHEAVTPANGYAANVEVCDIRRGNPCVWQRPN